MSLTKPGPLLVLVLLLGHDAPCQNPGSPPGSGYGCTEETTKSLLWKSVTDPSLITLGSVALQRGMSQVCLLERLRVEYHVEQLGESGKWVLLNKQAPYDKAATLYFEGGRLVWASKTWGDFKGQNTVRIAGALFSAISSLAKEGRASVVLTTATDRGPTTQTDSITFEFEGKQLVLTVYRGRAASGLVLEHLLIEESNEFTRTTAPKRIEQ